MRKTFFQVFLSGLVLLLGLLGAHHLITSKKKPPSRLKKKAVLAVKVVIARSRPYTYTVETTGTVVAPRKAELSSEVPGRLVYMAPDLLPGNVVPKGTVLFRLDPTDYQAALLRAKAELAQAKRALAEIEAEAERSLLEWKRLKGKAPPPPLVIKKPQLLEARARVKAAEAAVEKAERDLERTVIQAPFTGRVLEVRAEVGSYASPGKTLARLYPLSGLEIYAPVADHFLPYLSVPGFNASSGSKAELIWEAGERFWRYQARVKRLGEEVDPKTRLVPLYLVLEDPSARPPLLPGVFLTVKISGKTYPRAFVLPRRVLHRLRGRPFVWVVRGERLERRWVKLLSESEKEVVIVKGLKESEEVVLGPLRGGVSGMRVRVLR